MARISTYPILSIPTINDILIGTDVEDLNITKNFSIGSISDIIGGQFVPYVGAIADVNLGEFNIEAASFVVQGGLASQFVKADGTLDSTVYTPVARTITINSVGYDLSTNISWDLNTIDSLTTLGTSGAATYIGKTLNIPEYQQQGDYITQLNGEATAIGPGNATITLSNLAVISKVLSGLNITGGTIADTDSILTAFGKVQNQINGLAGGVTYEGTWDASANIPNLQSSVGVQGHYYVVSVPGSTNLNGITDWQLGDWAIFNGSVWEKVDNTDAVVSVNGYTGAVVLTYSDVGAPPSTRTLTINGVGYDLSADRSWIVGDVRTDQTYSNPTWISSLAWGKITGTPTTLAGYGITDAVPSDRTLTINGTTYDLSANRTWDIGTITSIATSAPLTGGTITESGTIGITQSGVSSDGYLSSTDWNTFNNKQDALINPVTGTGTVYFLPMWSGATSLINSPLSYVSDNYNFQYNSTSGGSVTFTNNGLTTYSYVIQMNNFGSPRSTVHSYTDGEIVQSIGGTQVSRIFASGNLIIGAGVVDNGYKLEVSGDLYVNTIANAITDTDKFIVSDGGVIKYRTGAEVLSDIDAQGALTLTTVGTSGVSTLIGNTLNIPNYSTDLTGYVPYIGATQNLNLGEYGLSTGFVTFDTTPTNIPAAQGSMYWDDSHSTVALIMNGTLQHIGQDTYFYVKNSSGSTIPKGTAVRFDGTDGASGHLLIAPFLADGTYPSSYFMGVASEEITNGSFGQVTNFGEIEGIDTSIYSAGDLLYASTTVAGGFQTTAPLAPNNIVLIAAAVNSKNNGAIIVRPSIGSNINNDEGVKIVSPATGQLLQLQSNGLWENKPLATVLTDYVTLNTSQTITASKSFTQGFNLASAGGTNQLSVFRNTGSLHTGSAGSNIFGFNSINNIYFGKGLSNGGVLQWNNSAVRYYTLQNGDGTLAFTSDITNALVNYQLLSEKSQPNGYASLDSNGKVPLNEINDALIGNVNFEGLWDASTNTPTLVDPPAAGTKGYYYIVTVAGTFAGISFEVGDWIISNGTSWGKVDNTDAVSSVFGRTGNVSAVEADYQAFYPRLSQSYANPSWISSLDWSKITSTPTTLAGYGITDGVTIGTTQTITGLKTILRSGDVLNFKIGTDTLYGLKVAYNQNELVPSGEATWSFVNTFNNGSGTGLETTPISFFRGVLVTGERLLSASVNANLLDYYGNNPAGRYPIYAYNTGVQQFASSIIVGETSGVVNAVTGAIADLPAGVVANFKGRVIGSDAVNNNEFATLGQITSVSRASISLTTTGTSGAATYDNVTGVLNIPEYQGGVTSFNTRTGAVTLTSLDVTDALGYTPVTDARTLTINGVGYDLTADRSWTVGVNPSAREIQTYVATASQTTFTVTGGYTVGLVDVYINGVRLTSSDYTATDGTTVVLAVGTSAGNIVDIIKYTSGIVNSISGSGTSNELAYFTASTTIASLSTATYPSLTELSYVKGVTSSIQTQLNGKQNTLTNPVTGTASAGQVAFWSSSSAITGESNLFWDASNDRLGIGTATPATPLHISTSGLPLIRITAGSESRVHNINAVNNGRDLSVLPFRNFSIITGNGIAEGLIVLNSYEDFIVGTGSSYTSRFQIFTDGNVSISNSPSNAGYKLDVNGTGRFKSFLYLGESLVENGVINSPEGIFINADSDASGGSNDIVFGKGRTSTSGGTTLMTIKNGGNVGIGTTSPGQLLTLGGTASPQLSIVSSTTTGSSEIYFGDSAAVYRGAILYDHTSDYLTLHTGAGERMRITSGGDVYLNNAAALFFGPTSVTYITGSTTNMVFAVNDAERMRITSSGNVGIGNTPIDAYTGYKLQIGSSSDSQTFISIGNSTTGLGPLNGLVIGNDSLGSDIYVRGAYPLRFHTNNTERMRIFSDGNVGINTGSINAGYKLDVNGTGRFSGNLRISKSSDSGSGSAFPRFEVENTLATQGDGSSTFNFADIRIASGNSAVQMFLGTTYAAGTWSPAGIINVASNNDLQIKTNNTERMRITSGGDVQIGLASNYSAVNLYLGTATNGSTAQGGQALFGGAEASQDTGHESGAASGSNYHRFIYSGAVIGSITQNGTSQVSYNTSSDYRLKEDLKEIDGLEKVSSLKVYNYKWKNSEERMDGVLAHELAEVLPYAVHGEKDGEQMQGVDYSKIVPILIKAIQELQAKLDKNNINQ